MIKFKFIFVLLLVALVLGVTSNPTDVQKPLIIEVTGLKPHSNSVDNIISEKPDLKDYMKYRQEFILNEIKKSIGSDIILNEREELANKIIMAAKNDEIKEGLLHPINFAPSRHLFSVLNQIKSSKLFQLIRKMPKGAVLHAHDTALCSTNFLLEITRQEHLYQCYDKETDTINLKFAKNTPESFSNCQWTLVSFERQKYGEQAYDNFLRRHFSLYTEDPLTKYTDIDAVWNKFIKIFSTVTPMLTYRPVWKKYYKNALKEFYEDNVQYLEFRGTLPTLYDLNGNTYTQEDTLRDYIEVLKEFKMDKKYSGFYGSKFIFGPNRHVDNRTFLDYMTTVVQLKNNFPEMLAGFDLVAQEDKGRPLIDFAKSLLQLPNNINFFFHAGETNWYGTSTDENLIDAVLLGTKRVGHGYAIIKHPSVVEVIKKKQIAIEVNPISNQVLKLNVDNRNHPGSYLFANNIPVVISSDDPSFWEATPLSHDFYIAFLGISSAHADLRTLKQLANNSITYSSLNYDEKVAMLEKWQIAWNSYIEWVINISKTEATSTD